MAYKVIKKWQFNNEELHIDTNPELLKELTFSSIFLKPSNHTQVTDEIGFSLEAASDDESAVDFKAKNVDNENDELAVSIRTTWEAVGDILYECITKETDIDYHADIKDQKATLMKAYKKNALDKGILYGNYEGYCTGTIKSNLIDFVILNEVKIYSDNNRTYIVLSNCVTKADVGNVAFPHNIILETEDFKINILCTELNSSFTKSNGLTDLTYDVLSLELIPGHSEIVRNELLLENGELNEAVYLEIAKQLKEENNKDTEQFLDDLFDM